MHLLVLAGKEIAETIFILCLEGMKHGRSESKVVLSKPFIGIHRKIMSEYLSPPSVLPSFQFVMYWTVAMRFRSIFGLLS
jgi:hypothetical protein